jgi:hypothetical protein
MKLHEFFEKENWTQGYCARDANGTPVEPRDKKAVCWDLFGGLMKCYPNDEFAMMNTRLHELSRRQGFATPSRWNDIKGMTLDVLVKALKEADI